MSDLVTTCSVDDRPRVSDLMLISRTQLRKIVDSLRPIHVGLDLTPETRAVLIEAHDRERASICEQIRILEESDGFSSRASRPRLVDALAIARRRHTTGQCRGVFRLSAPRSDEVTIFTCVDCDVRIVVSDVECVR